MQWIRRGRQLGQAVRNAQRLRQIVGTFAKYGFVDVVERLRLSRFVPSRLATIVDQPSDLSQQVRFRLALQDLGPTFVKLGQLLSTRPDILPESFVEELTQLQDKVAPLSFAEVEQVLEKEWGAKGLLAGPDGPIKPTELFADFDREPLAAASISQVHAATLKTGEQVVVKIQRPGIGPLIEQDIALLTFLAGLMERYVPESRVFQPKVIVDEFFRTISFELDFVVEASNMTKMADNLKNIPEIAIPRVYKQFSSRRVLTLERFKGRPFSELKSIENTAIDKRHLVQVGVRAFFRTVLIDGLFHGDLHGGNLFVLPDGRIGMLDFGIVGRLSQTARTQLANMVFSLVTEDYENLCYQYAELGAASANVDFDAFQRDVRNSLSPYMGLALKDVNTGKILIEATKIATRYHIKVPGEWMMVFKALLTTEGMGRTLDPDFNVLEIADELIRDLLKSQYSVKAVAKDALWVAKDLAALAQTLPRQIRWMFKKFNSNDFAFEIKSTQLEDIKEQLDTNGRRSSLSTIATGLFVAGALALNTPYGATFFGQPAIAMIFFGVGGLIALRIIFFD